MSTTVVSVDPAAKAPGRVRRNWNRMIKGSVAATLGVTLPITVDGTGSLNLHISATGGLSTSGSPLSIVLASGSQLSLSASGLSVVPSPTFTNLSVTNETISGTLTVTTLSTANLSLTNLTVSGSVIAAVIQISTAPTANSTGTVSIVAKDPGALTANAGWLPFKRSDGTIVYVPYWT